MFYFKIYLSEVENLFYENITQQKHVRKLYMCTVKSTS